MPFAKSMDVSSIRAGHAGNLRARYMAQITLPEGRPGCSRVGCGNGAATRLIMQARPVRRNLSGSTRLPCSSTWRGATFAGRTAGVISRLATLVATGQANSFFDLVYSRTRFTRIWPIQRER